MKLLWDDWAAWKKRLRAAPKRVIFLDFDGTLAPIAPTPGSVRFDECARRRVAALAAAPENRVCIISGRSLGDLKTYFQSRRLLFVGNHGLEMQGRGLKLPAPALRARRLRRFMLLLTEKISAEFHYLPGVFVEDKGLTISLHYRNLPDKDMPAFNEALRFFRRRHRRRSIAWRRGKKVWEVFPKVHWHKGFAALHVMKRFPGAMPVAIGDDRTDEDMFRALRKFGLTVRVGYAGRSSAKYYVKTQKEVEELLEEMKP